MASMNDQYKGRCTGHLHDKSGKTINIQTSAVLASPAWAFPTDGVISIWACLLAIAVRRLIESPEVCTNMRLKQEHHVNFDEITSSVTWRG